VSFICKRVLKDATLDVFYLITLNRSGISKIDILKEYQSRLGVPSSPDDNKKPSQKYRTTVDEAIAMLLGTTFIDYYPDGTSFKYFLTQNGEIASDEIFHLLTSNPELLLRSKILSEVMKKGE